MKGGMEWSWVSAGFVILAWGVTFANTRALLRDFSALEIQLLRFALAVWGATEQGYYALDGSFSVTLDADINLERFSRPVNWVNIAFLGGVASAACFVLWNGACKALGVVRTTVGLYLTPIVGVVFASLFLGERLTAMSAAGGVVIVAGVVVANYGFWRDGK